MQGKKAYRMFHGKPPRKVEELFIHYPKQLTLLGDAVAIEYRTNKLHGGGDGKTHVWRHEFKKGAKVCMDEKCKSQLYIIGERIRVTDAGIEN